MANDHYIDEIDEAITFMSGAESAMAPVPFTQFIRPNGREEFVQINLPLDTAAKAKKIIAAGFYFTCEVLHNGFAVFYITDDNRDYATEVVVNGPTVPERIIKMINENDPEKLLKMKAERDRMEEGRE